MAVYLIPRNHSSLFLQIIMAYLLLSSVLSTCQFPEFINHEVVWFSTNAEGAHLTAYIKPHIMEAKFCSVDSTACEHYTRTCEENFALNKYMVKHEISSHGYSPSYYVCMQFIYRSADIIQIRSSVKSEIPIHTLCFDDNLVLDNWPLVATSLKEASPIQCPFSGGYNMRIKSNGREMCSDKMMSPRIESECEAGDGITFDFKHPDCVHPNLKMKLSHKVDCMATWTYGDFHFIILRLDSERLQALCMRVKNPLNNLKHAYLFMDLVCDPGNSQGQPEETSNYLSIEFERKYIHSVCEDEFEGCSDDRFCRTDMKRNCRLSCGVCQPDIKLCAFPEYMRKVWSLYEQGKPMRYVNITTYEVGFPNVGTFKCLYNNISKKHKSILLHTFENGCYPKFTCMETFYSSDTVRQFRLGKRLNWPMFPLSRVRKLACEPRMFKMKDVIDENREMKIPKITVIDASYTKSVNCKLSKEFNNHGTGLYFKESDKCDGCVYHDGNIHPQSFEVRPIKCPNTSRFIEYICLASFTFDNETTAVVTGTRTRFDNRLKQFLCWIFTGTGKMRKIVVFDAADCNVVHLKLALVGEIFPKSMFDVIEKPPKHCPLPINDDPDLPEPVVPITISPPTRKTQKPDVYETPPQTYKPNTPEKMNSLSNARKITNSLFLQLFSIFVIKVSFS